MDGKPNTTTQAVDNQNELLYQKLREHFSGKIVRKDLTKSLKEGANVPV